MNNFLESIKNEIVFENNFGSLNHNHVTVKTTNEIYSFEKVAFIEMFKLKKIWTTNVYLKIIFTNATSKSYKVDKKQLESAIAFQKEFTKYRAVNTRLD